MPDTLQFLIDERDRLDQAIAALQEPVRRRGRPPGSKATKVAAPKKRTMSPAARKAAAERMRAYWAKRRKATKKVTKKAGQKAGKRKQVANATSSSVGTGGR
jgi:hypothetical protein